MSSQFGFKLKGESTDALEIDVYDVIADSFWGGVSARAFRDVLKKNKSAKNITVRINSDGGDVFEGFAIYNLLVEHKAHKVVQIDGIAASMASVIAMAGDEIVMPENAWMMIHNPWTIKLGDAEALRATADLLEKSQQQLASTYSKRTGQPVADVLAAMDAETWMTAAEAKAAGYATKVIDAKKLAAACELKDFAHVPPAAAALRKATVTRRASGVLGEIEFNVTAPAGTSPQDISAAVRSELDKLGAEHGAAPPKEKTMKYAALFALLGLSAEASEEAALSAGQALKGHADVGKKLCAITGKDGDAAIGTVTAWKEQAEKVPALESAAIEAKAAADKGALTALLEKGRADKKLTKATSDALQARVEAGFKAKDEMRSNGKVRDLTDDEWTLGQAKAYVEALTPNAVLARGEEVHQPKAKIGDALRDGGSNDEGEIDAVTFQNKRYEEFTPGEMAQLRNGDLSPETYAEMRADWLARGKPAVKRAAA